MSPGEIRACYQLYAAHRRSHEICTFPEIIPVTNNAGYPDDLAVLLRRHTGFEGLRREIVRGDPNDPLVCPPLGTPVTCEKRSHHSLPSYSVGTLW
jgi:hypothetical protein